MPFPALRAVLITALAAMAAAAQTGMRDRYFTRYPFDRWKAEGNTSGIKWSPKVLPARLSTQQRLLSRIEVQVDSIESARRRGRGELVVLLELTDSEGRHFRTHEAFSLGQIPDDAKTHPILFAQNVLMRPGDYRMTLAICDSTTLDHSVVDRAIRIAPLRNDPLPDAWSELPPVEFMRNFEPPDSWYQPSLRGRLNLPVATRGPVHIDLMVNMTASERMAGSLRVFRRNMSVLVPSLKLLAGMAVKEGSVDITLLDLTKQQVWEQTDAHGLNWARMRAPFATANPGIVDVQSLSARAEMRRYFRDRLLGKLKAPREEATLRVVIVLGAPLFLEKQQKLAPAPLAKDRDRRVFYVRYRPLPQNGPGGRGPDGMIPAIASDDLEGIVRSLDGRTFSVQTPEDFRKALAAILTEVSKM